MKLRALNMNKRFYYGWMMVFMSALALLFSAPGQTYSISIFINVYETEFGYTKTALSTGYSIATILSGSLLIFIGKATDRFGQRTMLMIVASMLALTTLLNSFIVNIWMIYVGFFLLRYFGQGSMTLIPASLVPQWFEKRRAFALSLSGFGNLVATMIVPIFNIWLINQFEWQNAWRFWGFALMFVFVPLVYLFVVNRPEDLGIPMENGDSSIEAAAASLEHVERTSWRLEEAVKTKEFWFIGLMSLIVPMFTTGITFHWIAMMAMRNVSRTQAGLVIGLIALPFVIMPFIARIFIDRYQPRLVFFFTLALIFVCMGWLGFFVHNVLSAVLFMLSYGLVISIQAVALNTVWPNYYGRKYLGSIRGASTAFMVVGSALGPLPFGVIYDVTGDFIYVIIGMMGMTLVAMLLALSIRQPVKKIVEPKI